MSIFLVTLFLHLLLERSAEIVLNSGGGGWASSNHLLGESYLNCNEYLL